MYLGPWLCHRNDYHIIKFSPLQCHPITNNICSRKFHKENMLQTLPNVFIIGMNNICNQIIWRYDDECLIVSAKKKETYTTDTFLCGRDKICYCDSVCLGLLACTSSCFGWRQQQQIIITEYMYVHFMNRIWHRWWWWWLGLMAAAHIRINFIVIHHIMRGWEMAQIDD